MTWENGDSFDSGGQKLYDVLIREGEDTATEALIIEAARAKDRLDRLHRIVSGDVDSWVRIFNETGENVLKLDSAVSEVRQLSTVFRQLLTEIQRRQGAEAGEEDDILGGLS